MLIMTPTFTFQLWEEQDFDLRKGTVPVLINILVDIFFSLKEGL